jgi:hypothetical protein
LGSVTFDQFGERPIFEIAPGQPQRAGFGLRNGLRSVCQQMIRDTLALALQVGKRHDLVNKANAMRFFDVETFRLGAAQQLGIASRGIIQVRAEIVS